MVAHVGVVQDKNRYIANLGKIRLGRYSDESKAGTAVAYGAIKTGLYKIDDRWLNFDRDEVKEKIKKYLTREEREQIRENLNGLKWA